VTIQVVLLVSLVVAHVTPAIKEDRMSYMTVLYSSHPRSCGRSTVRYISKDQPDEEQCSKHQRAVDQRLAANKQKVVKV
jgi:hypothetical protein